MAKIFEENVDSFHHCVECGFLFDCARSCLERSPVNAVTAEVKSNARQLDLRELMSLRA
jgi:hypothetical protein